MRIPVAVLAAVVVVAFGPAARALDAEIPPAADPSARETLPATRETGPNVPAPLPRDKQLDALFATLKSGDGNAARAAEDGIMAIWMKSGSDTADLLMRWSMQAVEKKDYPGALDYLDRVISMNPDFAEAWNRRATVYYLMDKYGPALADMERVLALEPRHFGTLAGLGTIFRELGDEKRALAAYRQALAIDPHLDNVQKAVDELTSKGVDGRSL
jgi:tetratricopeptide (TPR) repeat protein